VALINVEKTIMLWDPDGPARKPPRESVDMLMEINRIFHLSDHFQNCLKPDFLLMSIGQTTRGAIERAYHWLIPIISCLPQAIGRLPSSASCFLLLRAYGTAGEERKQLKELAAPLLRHVKDSLSGRYGESDAVKAFDLLMTDVATNKPEKRRCARKVLQDSLLVVPVEKSTRSSNIESSMRKVLELEHAPLLALDSIKHMVGICLPIVIAMISNGQAPMLR
jgi:integrator complex subunit 1